MCQILKGNTHDLKTSFAQEFDQMRVQNPVEHLRCSFLGKLETAKCC